MTNAKNTYTGFAGNQRSEYDDFDVSFNSPAIPGSWLYKPDVFEGETALIVDGHYYILNGDWRLTYDELAPLGVQVCLNFFTSKQPLFGSSWSEKVGG